MEKDKRLHFSNIYSIYYRKCFLFAKSYVHNVDVADDFASEAMMKLWENFLGLEDVKNEQAFLLTVVKNLSINYLRHEKMKSDAHNSIFEATQREIDFRISTLEACDPQIIFSEEVRTLFEQTLATLSPQTRLIYNLSRVENKSNKEIAAIFGISVKGVDFHISKAMKALRQNSRREGNPLNFVARLSFLKL